MDAELLNAVLRSDFKSFVAKTFATLNPGQHFFPNWHIDAIAEHLQAIERGELTRLIINMPPRALKSITVVVAFPAWLLGHAPQKRIIAASYALPLSIKHNLDTREVLTSPWFMRAFPQCRIAKGVNEKHKFLTTARGFRLATSVGAGLTGEGGDVLMIDDPLTPEQAMQAHARGLTNHWFEHTFASRLDDKQKGAIVLVMQRLHKDDLSGYLLNKKTWQHLNLPAIAEADTIVDFGKFHYERRAGEPLNEARENADTYAKLKAEMGSHVFSAQYQQQPVPDEGFIIKPEWIKLAHHIPEGRTIQSWDTAIKAGFQNDASVCVTGVLADQNIYIKDVQVVRLEYPDLKRRVLQLAELHKPSAILMEDKASGQQLLQDLRKTSTVPLIATHPKSDKLTRVQVNSALMEAGQVFLYDSAYWLPSFKRELFEFPTGKHDDQVDAFIQLLEWARKSAGIEATLRTI